MSQVTAYSPLKWGQDKWTTSDSGQMQHVVQGTACYVAFYLSLSWLPFEFVFFVLDVIGFIVAEEVCNASGQATVDAVHVAGGGHDSSHVLMAVLNALLYLKVVETNRSIYQNPCSSKNFVVSLKA